jgi:menaquinone-specific isochorismate synthase
MTHAALDTALHASTRAIDAPGELLDHLGHDGFAWFGEDVAFVTAGVVAELEALDAPAFLAAIPHDGSPSLPAAAAGPIATGALPFTGEGRMVVPARVVGVTIDGRAWETSFAGVHPSATAPHGDPPSRFTVEPIASRAQWDAAVVEALDAIERGALEKVVLARAVRVLADTCFVVPSVLAHLRRAQPGCFVYADRGFVGATPELLMRRRGNAVACRPMAGTIAHGANRDDLVSAKNAHEHDVVASEVAGALRRVCDDVRVSGPEPSAFADVTHLVTHVSGRLRDGRTTALDLARALHPTPAVAGVPRDVALDLIARVEPTPRGRYAGPVGWLHASGDGEFAVALRCAAIRGREAVLHAGAGIVAGSQPASEWDETGAKLDPMLRALVRP